MRTEWGCSRCWPRTSGSFLARARAVCSAPLLIGSALACVSPLAAVPPCTLVPPTTTAPVSFPHRCSRQWYPLDSLACSLHSRPRISPLHRLHKSRSPASATHARLCYGFVLVGLVVTPGLHGTPLELRPNCPTSRSSRRARATERAWAHRARVTERAKRLRARANVSAGQVRGRGSNGWRYGAASQPAQPFQELQVSRQHTHSARQLPIPTLEPKGAVENRMPICVRLRSFTSP